MLNDTCLQPDDIGQYVIDTQLDDIYCIAPEEK